MNFYHVPLRACVAHCSTADRVDDWSANSQFTAHTSALSLTAAPKAEQLRVRVPERETRSGSQRSVPPLSCRISQRHGHTISSKDAKHENVPKFAQLAHAMRTRPRNGDHPNNFANSPTRPTSLKHNHQTPPSTERNLAECCTESHQRYRVIDLESTFSDVPMRSRSPCLHAQLSKRCQSTSIE